MPSERIALAVDCRERPMNFTRLLWSSEGTAWAGFRLERHTVGPIGRLKDFMVPAPLLGLCLRGSANLEFGGPSGAGAGTRAVVGAGQFTLLAAGLQTRSIAWTGTRETLYLSLTGDHLTRLMGDSLPLRGPSLVPQHAVINPQVTRLMLNMVDEVQAGCPAGALYAESLSAALAGYLLRSYGRCERPEPVAGLKFTRKVAARVQEFVRANLDRNIALAELAALARLSPHHFALVFRNTFGTSPHQYLLGERIDLAKRLLEGGGHSIGAAAIEAGFSDQSHFTRMFRRHVGQTPRQFQRALA